MLAYVFWHSASSIAALPDYLQRLHAFHHELQNAPPPGLLGSATWRIGRVPWLDGVACCEDWYVLESVASLDDLAQAAISRPLRAVHDAVAGLSASGIAGLYKPVHDAVVWSEGERAAWFDKPAGESYDDLYRYLDERIPAMPRGLWQRYLTLGPTPEFCLIDHGSPDLPPAYRPLIVPRRHERSPSPPANHIRNR